MLGIYVFLSALLRKAGRASALPAFLKQEKRSRIDGKERKFQTEGAGLDALCRHDSGYDAGSGTGAGDIAGTYRVIYRTSAVGGRGNLGG